MASELVHGLSAWRKNPNKNRQNELKAQNKLPMSSTQSLFVMELEVGRKHECEYLKKTLNNI